ncbi:L,D-transpeptidase family protein, partial [bacterium]|nr:L,D-transpeptidase family protein [bacterium]
FGIGCAPEPRKGDRDPTATGRPAPPSAKAVPAFLRSPDLLVAEQIRIRIEDAGVVAELKAGGEPVYASEALPGFYERRLYLPGWSNKRGPTRRVDELIGVLRGADLEGLRTEDYHFAAIESLLVAVRTDIRSAGVIIPDRWAELDLLLTDAFLVYGSHLLAGRVNPETLSPEWVANRRGADLTFVLEKALKSGDIAGALAELAPPQRGFRRLREALAYHRAVADRGGWSMIPGGPGLKRGDHGPAVAALRERLRLGGDFGDLEWDDIELFDEELERILKGFQKRHGLTATGVMDAATLAELNVSVEDRIHRLELNLERWRWLPQDLGKRHIIVNIAAFELQVEEKEETVLSMRVVVGRPYHSTPVFSDTMRYLVINPYWNVPRNIAVREVIPHILRDSAYLTKEKTKVFKGWGPEALEIDPATVDWTAVDTTYFPYRLRQDSGPVNALGRIKFMFLNKYNVYLHDTPARRLFERDRRDFSHGCIRIQQPFELALYLLKKNSRWNREALLRELGESEEHSVPLPEPIPVHLLYWTAWADADGTIQFRRDIYNRDLPLLKALRTPPSAKG